MTVDDEFESRRTHNDTQWTMMLKLYLGQVPLVQALLILRDNRSELAVVEDYLLNHSCLQTCRCELRCVANLVSTNQSRTSDRGTLRFASGTTGTEKNSPFEKCAFTYPSAPSNYGSLPSMVVTKVIR